MWREKRKNDTKFKKNVGKSEEKYSLRSAHMGITFFGIRIKIKVIVVDKIV